jgi:hypothetical protein
MYFLAMHTRVVVCALLAGLVSACAGPAPAPTGGGGTGPDAASGGGSGGAFGATCTTVSTTSTECASKLCTDVFTNIGHPVCSQMCTAGDSSTCPTGSQGMMCNNQGYCRP